MGRPLGKISAITAECDTTSIIIAGDFNAGKGHPI